MAGNALRPGNVVRAVGHPIVTVLAKHQYGRIAEREDLTAGQELGAVIGTAIMQFLGHVAVEAAAEWMDSGSRRRR